MVGRICLGLTLPLLVSQAPASWVSFAPKDGAFTVKLPAIPVEKTKQVDSPAGKLTTRFYLCDEPGDGAYVVSLTDYPAKALEGNPEKRLNNARDGAVASAKGKLVHERKIKLAGHSGRELWIEADKTGMIQTRIYFVKQRLYQTMAIGPKEFVETKETAAFLDSFRLAK
jgi:hypothetical protein